MGEHAGNHEEIREQFVRGDKQALATLFTMHRQRLWDLVHFRLDGRLGGRVDADDVLQEAYLDAAERIQHFEDEHSGSIFVWLRLIVIQTLTNVHRRHLGAKMRDANRDISLFGGMANPGSSTTLALQLLGHLTSPSRAIIRDEEKDKLEEAINSMDPIDREVLEMRHFEHLTNNEVAEVLGIQKKAASNRYIRSLKRLKDRLSQTGLSED